MAIMFMHLYTQIYILCIGCATELYVMAFTTTDKNANSDDLPSLSVTLTSGDEETLKFPNNQDINEQTKGKGDLWEFKITKFDFQTDNCITKSDISEVTIHNGGDDGWKIESVVTILHGGLSFDVVTADMHVDRWIDGNNGVSRQSYDLTVLEQVPAAGLLK